MKAAAMKLRTTILLLWCATFLSPVWAAQVGSLVGSPTSPSSPSPIDTVNMDKPVTVMFRVAGLDKDTHGAAMVRLVTLLPIAIETAPGPNGIEPNVGEVLTCVTGKLSVGVIDKGGDTTSIATLDCGKDVKLMVVGLEFTPKE